MGISGLLPFLDASSRKCYINEFRGCTVAIDTYCWLHKAAFACAEKLVRGESTNIYIDYCLKYIKLLQSYDIKPILVFDGQHLPAKKDTEAKRREQRKLARAKGMQLLRLGEVDKARQYFQKCIDVTHEMALNLIKHCRIRDIDCIVAPYEADAQLAFLNIQGIADIIITEDSDLILFGCSKILFKFKVDGSGILVEKSNLNKSMKMRPDQYSFEKFRYMCILSGCDYLDSLPGIGIVRAHKAISMTHNPNIYHLLPRLPRYLNLSKLIVPDEYIEKFKIADATLQHQIVFDPLARKLKPLIDPSETNTDPKYLVNAGEIRDSIFAFQMALGNIDPISHKIVDRWNPDNHPLLNTSSIWSVSYKKPDNSKKSENSPIAKPSSTKNIEAKMPTGCLLAKQENIHDYDKKLMEEIKMYMDIEHTVKCIEAIEAGRIKKKMSTETHSNNPFVKKKSSKLSKFQATSLNKSEVVKSRFFNSNSEKVPKIYKLVEEMDTEDIEKNEDDLNCSNQCITVDDSSDNKSCDTVSDEFGFRKNNLVQKMNADVVKQKEDDLNNSNQCFTIDDTSESKSNDSRSDDFSFRKNKLVEKIDTEDVKQKEDDLNCSISIPCITIDDTSESKSDDSLSDDFSFSQNALNEILVCNKDALMDQKDSNTTSPVLSRKQKRDTGHLEAFQRDKTRKTCAHVRFDSTLIETISLSDEVESTQNSIKDLDDNSSDFVKIQNDNTQQQPSGEGFLDNTDFIQKKSKVTCRKVGLSRNVKKSRQPTLTTMFFKLSKK